MLHMHLQNLLIENFFIFSFLNREILPLPRGVLDMFKEDSVPEDEPSKHDGRVRTFSHFPGNWAMHVFIPFKASVHFESLVVSVVECLSVAISHEVHTIPCDELHMSVSRTVPIRHYWIDPIVQQLKNGFSTVHSFVSALQCPEVYTNDEETRSFVALKIMSEYKKFKDIVDVVDGIFQEFSLPTFYKNPSFHVSIAWCLGDICSENTDEIQTKLQDVFDAEVCEKEVARSLVLEVKEVHCKIGNKHFVFPLDAT
ncbi:U6 snRNA phosphodiesterase-like [Orbicella faveolata]|uniref:U6 snRNA phosphodiesterase-like n=1 Tax=Orbicella faveolata TaxID=48498 RepID=UPI0009E36024|nr:U6 snRNA phosphodiesterase-like [Orbicella faveolata]